MALHIDSACANGLPQELTRLHDIGVRSISAVYSPLILNTILIMFYFNQKFGNLFIPMETAPYGGYQLTLINDIASEREADATVNNNVNILIKTFIDSGKDKIAVSLMFIDPTNAANNHANIIIFLKGDDGRWYVYHYEPHGPQLAANFQNWFRTGTSCINAILERLGINNIHNYTYLQTRIEQTYIERIQDVKEGGYCQMISALQAYLFLKFCKTPSLDPNENTPLGSSIISPVKSEQTPRANGIYQLNIIRGFVIFISNEINNLLFSGSINFSISRISEIHQYYQNQREITGRYRPLYLLYLDAVFRYIIEEEQGGKIILSRNCVQGQDCGYIEKEIDFSSLDAQVTPLLGLLNGTVVLTRAAKMQIYHDFRAAAREAAAREAAAREAAAQQKEQFLNTVIKNAYTKKEGIKRSKVINAAVNALVKTADDLGTKVPTKVTKVTKAAAATKKAKAKKRSGTGGSTRKNKKRTQKYKRKRKSSKRRKCKK